MASGNVSLDDANLRSKETEPYIPSAVERKRVAMVYTIIGLIFFLQKESFSVYEEYHFKQAIGWGFLMISYLIVSIILLFLPVIKRIAMIGLVLMFVIWVLMLRQARNGQYIILTKHTQKSSQKQYQFFMLLGQRILDIFGVETKVDQQ